MGSPTNPDQRIGKQHVKKKLFRIMCKIQAQAGKINTADGQWTARNGIPDTSMRRDYNSGKGA